MTKRKVDKIPDSVPEDNPVTALQAQVAEMSVQIGQLANIIAHQDERIIQITSAVVDKSMTALAEKMTEQRQQTETERQAKTEQYEKEVEAANQAAPVVASNGNFISQLVNALPQFIDAYQKVKGPPTPEQQVFRELEMGFKIHRALDSMKTGDISAFENIFKKS